MPSAITPEDFLAKSGTDDLIRDFRQKLENEKRLLAVSDVRDEHGHQYVDLVQEGGGVLGIALVGYTYVLEKMGIRFFSLAGTSAGSINAMLLACSGNKEEEKSSCIVKHLALLEMFSFVDGKPGNWRFTRWVKKWIQKMLLGGEILKKLRLLFVAGAHQQPDRRHAQQLRREAGGPHGRLPDVEHAEEDRGVDRHRQGGADPQPVAQGGGG